MDNIFDRAHDLIDKAQERVATATSQAAWTANQTLVIKGLEGQLSALQAEIERVTSDIGERTYQSWRTHAGDPRIDALCAHLDDLKNRRVQVSADLDAARAATYDPQAVQGAWQTSQRQRAIQSPPPVVTVQPAPPTPAIAPPRQAPTPAVPPSAPSQQSAAPTQAQGAPPRPQPAPSTPSTPPTQRAAPAAAAPVQPVQPAAPAPAPAPLPTASSAEPPRPAPQARECPNCGHFVPATTEYCPACGLRVT